MEEEKRERGGGEEGEVEETSVTDHELAGALHHRHLARCQVEAVRWKMSVSGGKCQVGGVR